VPPLGGDGNLSALGSKMEWGFSMILSAAADINVGHPVRRQGRRFDDYRNAFRNSGNFLRKRIKSRRSLA
jgi:hypothetical protein